MLPLKIRIGMRGFVNREAGCIGLAQRPVQMYPFLMVGRQVILDIAFLDEAHGNSNLLGCVLKRCSSGAKPGLLKARREKLILLRAYA